MRAGLRSLLSSDKTIKVMTDLLDEENEADVVVMSALLDSFAENGSALRLGSGAGVGVR